MIGEIMLCFLLIAMGFCIGFPIGAEWRKKQWTSKIPYQVYYNGQWYMVTYAEGEILDKIKHL